MWNMEDLTPSRVAVLGDAHGNAVALDAVLEEVRAAGAELVVWTGDLSWGWEPAATLALVRSLEIPARYVRGNAERFLLELREGTRDEPTEVERWMLEQHGHEEWAVISAFTPSVSTTVDGLGPTYFCHGSPRSDNELLTAETPASRIAMATAGIAERVLVSGHTHAQYDREVAGVRALNPGSVGMPYEGRPGAYWALLGPDVELRRTEYDLDEALARIDASGYPRAEQMVEVLTKPPTPAGMIEHAEQLEFSD